MLGFRERRGPILRTINGNSWEVKIDFFGHWKISLVTEGRRKFEHFYCLKILSTINKLINFELHFGDIFRRKKNCNNNPIQKPIKPHKSFKFLRAHNSNWLFISLLSNYGQASNYSLRINNIIAHILCKHSYGSRVTHSMREQQLNTTTSQ